MRCTHSRVRACDFGALHLARKPRCRGVCCEERTKGWQPCDRRADPPEGSSASRWPADVYNLALIAGPDQVVARERRPALGSTAIRRIRPWILDRAGDRSCARARTRLDVTNLASRVTTVYLRVDNAFERRGPQGPPLEHRNAFDRNRLRSLVYLRL